MPIDANGVRAEIAMLSKGIIARTNLGKLYEQYFAISSRQTRLEIMDILNVKEYKQVDTLADSVINTAYDYLLEYFSLFKTLQYKIYAGELLTDEYIKGEEVSVSNNITADDKREVIREVVAKELYIIYNVSEEESAYNIVCRLEESKFKVREVDVFIKDPLSNELKKLRNRHFIGPMHIVMLDKITDDFLGSSTFFLNGYGLPTGNGKTDGRFPYKFKGVKAWGESEIRLAAAYGTPKLMQILFDRSRSISNHRQYYRNQLRSGSITTEELVNDRVEDSDVAFNILKAILEPAGSEIEITPKDV